MSYVGDPAEVANRMLRETLTANDTNIDFGPSLKRVQYDLDETLASIRDCVAGDTASLIEVVQDVRGCSSTTEDLKNSLEDISGECSRLESDFVRPYERLQLVHNASQRLQATSRLVRSLHSYLLLAKELEDSKELLASAAYVSKLKNLLVSDPQLKSIQVVRNHSARLGGMTSTLVQRATQTINDFSGSSEIRPAVLSMCLFDSEKLLELVDPWLKAQTSASVLAITRSFSTEQAFNAAWALCQERASAVKQFNQVLEECFLVARAENKVGGALLATYYALVEKNLKAKLHTMSVANPGQFKAMKQQKENILATAPQLKAVFIDY